jgi:hypothetical protein
MATKTLPVKRAMITAVVIVVGASSLTACGGNRGVQDSSGETETVNSDGTTSATAEASTVQQQEVADLVAQPDVSFEVVFRWLDENAKEPGYFVWKQANGRRRWDSVRLEGGQPVMGSISVETAFSPGVAMGNPSVQCLWFISRTKPDQVNLECVAGGWGGAFGFLPLVLFSVVDERVPDQKIAGRVASCYSLKDPRLSVALLCVDSSEGIPLGLAMAGEDDPSLSQIMEARSVSVTEQNLAVPLELVEDPLTGIEQARATVPFSSLQLPDFRHFAE